MNADGHPLMGRLHRPGDEKRMPVLLTPPQFDAWLHATPERAHTLMRTVPAEQLVGEPAPRAAAPRRDASKPVGTPSLF